MSDLRKAAQQALEAWDRSRQWPFPIRPDKEFDALRAALAQPIILPKIKGDKTQLVVGGDDLPTLTKWTPQPAQSDPVEVRQGWEYMREKGLLQEPVACQYAQDVAMPEYRCVGECQYAHSPQRQPLTDEEIYEVLGYGAMAQYNSVPKYAIEFTRAIEKAHGIGP